MQTHTASGVPTSTPPAKDWNYLQNILSGNQLPQELTPTEEHHLAGLIYQRESGRVSWVSSTLLALLQHELTESTLWRIVKMGRLSWRGSVATALLEQENLTEELRLVALKITIEETYDPREMVSEEIATPEETEILDALYDFGCTGHENLETYLEIFAQVQELTSECREIFLGLVRAEGWMERTERYGRLQAILEISRVL